MTNRILLFPILSPRFIHVWRRNARVWRKILLPSILGNFGEPVLYLLAFGYGFGRLVGTLDDIPYMVFLASGIICSSSMFTASFEGMYSAYTRMDVQQTWSAMLGAPLTVDDIVLGEVVWAATKGLLSAGSILVVAAVLGLVAGWQALLALPVLLLTGFTFGACAMVVTAFSRSYDFFLYYFTLVITPMLLLSGVFFPLEQFPEPVQQAAYLLPLAHAVDLVRPLVIGGTPQHIFLHLAVIAAYGIAALVVASHFIRRRLIR